MRVSTIWPSAIAFSSCIPTNIRHWLSSRRETPVSIAANPAFDPEMRCLAAKPLHLRALTGTAPTLPAGETTAVTAWQAAVASSSMRRRGESGIGYNCGRHGRNLHERVIANLTGLNKRSARLVDHALGGVRSPGEAGPSLP